MHCARCYAALPFVHAAERCWWCFHPLCGDCWDAWGHGGHDEADQMNHRIRAQHARQEGDA